MVIELILNGERMALEAPGTARLLDVLRQAGLTSVKEGCGEGECGACTVLLDGDPVCSCLVFAGQAQGRRVDTVEALAEPALHPLTDAVVDAAGVQCGYCTPGIVLSAKALLDANPAPSRHEIQVALSGNLCRCTGYHRIIDAVAVVARGEQKRRAATPAATAVPAGTRKPAAAAAPTRKSAMSRRRKRAAVEKES